MAGSLNSWDRTLIQRHLLFYQALDFGQRKPDTPLQAHFVACCRGAARHTTQHEIAYQRYRFASLARPVDLTETAKTSARVERVVDWIDAQSIEPDSQGCESLFDRARSAYRSGYAKAKRASIDAAIVIQSLLSDNQTQTGLAGWTAGQFGDLSNIYTKAMDGSFAEGLKAGADYVAPRLHRIVEGHTPWEAWSRVCRASDCDSGSEEFWGFVSGYASDLATQAGMPLASMSKQSFEQLADWVAQAGIDRSTLADLLTVNLVEVIAGALPLLAVLHGWSKRDAETFAKMAGGVGLAAVFSANPLAMIVALACLAKAFTDAGASDRWRGLGEGVLKSGIYMGTSAAVGGPAIVGVVAGIAIALVIRRAAKDGLPGFAAKAQTYGGSVLRTVADYAVKMRTASAFAKA